LGHDSSRRPALPRLRSSTHTPLVGRSMMLGTRRREDLFVKFTSIGRAWNDVNAPGGRLAREWREPVCSARLAALSVHTLVAFETCTPARATRRAGPAEPLHIERFVGQYCRRESLNDSQHCESLFQRSFRFRMVQRNLRSGSPRALWQPRIVALPNDSFSKPFAPYPIGQSEWRSLIGLGQG
jgi:hypothetical protein